jgi:hypothetical protein
VSGIVRDCNRVCRRAGGSGVASGTLGELRVVCQLKFVEIFQPSDPERGDPIGENEAQMIHRSRLLRHAFV